MKENNCESYDSETTLTAQAATTTMDIQIKEWAKDLSKYFNKEDIPMANKHRHCTSLVTREMQTQNHNQIAPHTQQMAAMRNTHMTRNTHMEQNMTSV